MPTLDSRHGPAYKSIPFDLNNGGIIEDEQPIKKTQAMGSSQVMNGSPSQLVTNNHQAVTLVQEPFYGVNTIANEIENVNMIKNPFLRNYQPWQSRYQSQEPILKKKTAKI